MAFVPSKKGTILIPSGPPSDPDKLHLHIILTDICPDSLHMLVNIATIREGIFHDPACAIEANEHPFVTTASYVNYRRAKTVRVDHIVKCVDGWLYKPLDPVDDGLFDRVLRGVVQSRFTPIRMKNYFSAQTGIYMRRK